jgi:hypothetical protein
MLKNKFIRLNPFRVMGYESEDIIPEGGLGVVAAYAGVGKTALMVQLALSAMLRGKKVLHISLNDPVNKVNLWYQELFNNIARQSGVEGINETWDAILPNRFIMTFKVEGFNFPKLKERMTDLIAQNIFLPQIVILDGLKFDESERDTLISLKAMAGKHAMRLWFTVHAHRHEESAADEMPSRLMPLTDLFDVVFKLQPEGEEIYIRPLRGKSTFAQPLFLDPATMLIKGS